MNDTPFFLDVNVSMYAAGKAHPYKESCVWVLTEIANGRYAIRPISLALAMARVRLLTPNLL